MLQKMGQKRYNKSETNHENANSIFVPSDFQTKYGLHECPIIYFGIVAAVKSLMKTQNLGDQTNHTAHEP